MSCRTQVLIWREPREAAEHLKVCRPWREAAFLSSGVWSIVVPENLPLRHFGAVTVDKLLEATTELPVDDTGEVADIRAHHTAHLFHRELFVCVAAVTLQTQQDTRVYALFACAHGYNSSVFGDKGTHFSVYRNNFV